MRTLFLLLLVTICTVLTAAPAGQAQAPLTDEAVRVLLETALRQYLDPGSELTVSVAGVTQSAEGMTIGSVTIDASPAIVRGVQGELFAQLSNVAVDAGVAAGAAGVGASVRIRSVGSMLLVGRTTAAELQKALAARFPPLVDPVVTLNAGQFTVTGRLRDGGQPAVLRGRFVVDRGTRVRVNVHEVTVGGSPIPTELVAGELAKINPILDLSGSPIPVRIRLIALHDNRIEVLAGAD